MGKSKLNCYPVFRAICAVCFVCCGLAAVAQVENKSASGDSGGGTAVSDGASMQGSEKKMPAEQAGVAQSQGDLEESGRKALMSPEAKLSAGDIEGAEIEIRLLLEQKPFYGRALVLLGKLYRAKGDLKNAYKCYLEARFLNVPGAAEALVEFYASLPLDRVQRGDFVLPNGELNRIMPECNMEKWLQAPPWKRDEICCPSNDKKN